MQGVADPLARAKALYERSVTPRRTQEMRGLLRDSAAETAAFNATTVLCQYLNRWEDAGEAELAEADAAIKQALDIDPNYFLAHYAQGFLDRASGRHEASLAAFDRTIAFAPEFARAYAQKGEELVYLGRPADGIKEVARAMELSPNSAVRGYFYWVIGRAQFFLEEDAEAISWLQRSIRAWPNVWYNRLYLLSAHGLTDQRSAARRVKRAFDQQFPGYTLAKVIQNEGATPDDNPLVVSGRERFHEGLLRAGLAR